MMMWPLRFTKKAIILGLLLAVALWLIGVAAVPKRERISDSDLDWMSTVPGYIQGTMSVGDDPLILDSWQEEICASESRFICDNKTRQGGWSFGCNAARALAKSQLLDRHLSVFTSVNLDDAKEKIRYARELYQSIPPSHRSRLIIDNRMQLEFANGSRIITMFMPRGKGPADVYIDEMAYMKRAAEIWRGAMGMIVRGGQIIVGSTPLGRSGLFWEIISNEGGRFPGFERHETPWWHCTALCRDVRRARLEAPLMTTKERVYEFGSPALIALFENTYLGDFRQEFELTPQADEESFFPLELIFRCVDPELPLYETFEDFKKNLKGIPYAGFDVGRRKNPSVLSILELLGDKYYERMLIPMHKMSFDEQKFRLTEALRILPIPRMCIDETGLGMNLAEDLSKSYYGIVVPVNFAGSVEAEAREKNKKATVAVKERLATNVKIAMERGRLALIQDRDTIKEIHSVKRETSALGQVRYAVEKNEQHHADRFWAIALAMFEMKRPSSGAVW